MIRKLILVLFILLSCASLANAGGIISFPGGGVPSGAATCNMTNVVFFNTLEDSTGLLNGHCTALDAPIGCCTGEDTGTCDYSPTDQSGTFVGGGAINADYAKYGSTSYDNPDNADTLTYDTPSVTLDDKGCMGFWIYPDAWTTGASLGRPANRSVNDTSGLYAIASNELRFRWHGNYADDTDCDTTDANISTSAEHYVKVCWNTTSNVRTIEIDGVTPSLTGCTDAIQSFSSVVTTMVLGNVTGDSMSFHIDNVILTTDDTQDLYTDCRAKEVYKE